MLNLGVVVDGYSTGRYYPKLFKEAGHSCLHVKSKEELPDSLTGCFGPSDYLAYITHQGINETSQWIKSFGAPGFIVSGMESGVNLADTLSNHFDLPTSNGIEKTEARRDKYLMMEALRSHNMRVIQQCATAGLAQALSWIQEQDLKFPIVVKPVNSTSGDGFFLCHSQADIENAFSHNLNRKNIFGLDNTRLLVQEYIRGDEYVVDTVSRDGKHVVTDFLKYEKEITPEGHSRYRAAHFLSRNFEHASTLTDYAFSVLDALEIKHGPAHIEIMLDQKGPVLIETGARLAGCMLDPEKIKACYGHNQIELSVLAYTDREHFFEKTEALSEDMQAHLSLAFLSAEQSGTVDHIHTHDIEQLPGVQKIELRVQEGQSVKKAETLQDIAAVVYLHHADPSVIKATLDQLWTMEKNFLSVKSDQPNPSIFPEAAYA